MKLNVERMRQRLHGLERYIAELEKQRQATLQTFRGDFTRQLAAERAFQAAVESCTDIAAHIVSVYRLGHPQESRDIYRFFVRAGYLDAQFGEAMVALVAFRNRLVHLYWDLDVERLYRCLQEDIALLHRFRDLVLQILTAEIESRKDDAMAENRQLNTHQERNRSLPTRRNLTLNYALSFLIAILMAAASVAGLLYRAAVYPTDDLLQSFVPTDVVNLLIGLPILLGSMWLAWRGKLIGLLLWPGALFFVLYNYLAYVFAMPLNVAFLGHLALVTLSVYTLTGLMASIDGEAVQQRLSGSVPERVAGGILAGLGLLFFLRVIGVLASALISQTAISETELAPNVSDFMVAPAMVIGGVLLWRRKEFGYVTGLGLLFQASMLFVGLIIFLLVQPFLTAAAFALVDVVVILILGLICFVPFGLFVRGVLSGRRSSPP